MAKVELVEITKKFGNVIALNKVSFEVDDGEFFALLGPSGSGKTTTLRIIAGLEQPDEGELYIDGQIVNDVHPKDRNVAMVFQNYALYPHMVVFENIAFPLNVRKRELGLTNEGVRKRVHEVARLLQIENLLERYPRQLSGGQQQRVALARALIRKPKVWLLDEPLSNLDAKLRLAMRSELKRLQRKLKITAVYVTHDQIEAMSMADRVAVMNSGVILQVGSPTELYRKPKDVFVATFIGVPSMNIIECELRDEDRGTYIICPNIKHRLDAELSFFLKKKLNSYEVLLGVRPEDISLGLSDEGIKGKVMISETLGAEQVLTVDVGGNMVKVKAPADKRFSIDEQVTLVFNWEKIHLFDAKTRKAVL